MISTLLLKYKVNVSYPAHGVTVLSPDTLIEEALRSAKEGEKVNYSAGTSVSRLFNLQLIYHLILVVDLSSKFKADVFFVFFLTI